VLLPSAKAEFDLKNLLYHKTINKAYFYDNHVNITITTHFNRDFVDSLNPLVKNIYDIHLQAVEKSCETTYTKLLIESVNNALDRISVRRIKPSEVFALDCVKFNLSSYAACFYGPNVKRIEYVFPRLETVALGRDLFSTLTFLDYELLINNTLAGLQYDNSNIQCLRDYYQYKFNTPANLKTILNNDLKLCVQSSNNIDHGSDRSKREINPHNDLHYYDDYEDQRVDLLRAYKCYDFIPPGPALTATELRETDAYKYSSIGRLSIDNILACTELGYFNTSILYVDLGAITDRYPLSQFDKKSRNKRWDSSFTCGWPLVSSFTKLVGGECEMTTDISAVKTSLNTLNTMVGQQNVVLDNFHKSFVIEHKQVYKLATELMLVNKNLKQLTTLTKSFIVDANDAMANITQSIICNSININANYLNSKLLQIVDTFDSNYNRFLAMFTIDKNNDNLPNFSLTSFASSQLLKYGVFTDFRHAKFIVLNTERTLIDNFSEIKFNGLLPLNDNITIDDKPDGYILNFENLYMTDNKNSCLTSSFSGLALCTTTLNRRCMKVEYLTSCIKSSVGDYYCARYIIDFLPYIRFHIRKTTCSNLYDKFDVPDGLYSGRNLELIAQPCQGSSKEPFNLTLISGTYTTLPCGYTYETNYSFEPLRFCRSDCAVESVEDIYHYVPPIITEIINSIKTLDRSSVGVNTQSYQTNLLTIQDKITEYTNNLTKDYTYDFNSYYNQSEAEIITEKLSDSKVIIDNIQVTTRILDKQIDSIQTIRDEGAHFGLLTILHLVLTMVLTAVVITLNKRLHNRYDKLSVMTIILLLPTLAFGKFTSNCTSQSEVQVCRMGKYDACHLINSTSYCFCAPTNNHTIWSDYDDCVAPGLAITTWNSFNKHISHDINYQNFFIYLILLIAILQLILFYIYVRPMYFRNFPSEQNFVTNIQSKFKNRKRKLPIFNNKTF